MGIKTYRPYTETRRFQSGLTFEELTTSTPHKPLLEPKTRISGRNNRGELTIWHRGGGHKRHYRTIDFKREKIGIPARVATVEYDPNRSAFISLLHYADGEKRYILYPLGLKVGDKVVSGPDADIVVGNALALKNIPVGTMVHNIELTAGRGGQMVRSAGGAAQVMAKEGDYVLLRLPSGELRRVRLECLATIGQVTAGALVGEHGSPVRRCAETLVRHNMVQFLSSDAHGMTARKRARRTFAIRTKVVRESAPPRGANVRRDRLSPVRSARARSRSR